MAKGKDLAGLAAIGALGYMLSGKGKGAASKTDTGDETARLAKRGDRMSNEDYIKSHMKKAPAGDAPSSRVSPAAVKDNTTGIRMPSGSPDAEAGMTRGTRPRDARDAESGMSRGTRTTSTAGAGRGSVNPPTVTPSGPRDLEAGMSRGTRTTSTAGAGRGSVNPPTVKPTDSRDAEAGTSRGTRTTSTAGAGRGSVNPPAVKPAGARDLEANMSRGRREMPPGPGQATVNTVRNLQSAAKVPTSNAGRPGYDEAGRRLPSNAGMPGYDEAGNAMKKGGKVKKMASGGMTASQRADGIASRGKTKCKIY